MASWLAALSRTRKLFADTLSKLWKGGAPEGVTLDELGGTALYLLSDMSGGVTGETHFVDSGYNIISMPHPDALKAAGEL